MRAQGLAGISAIVLGTLIFPLAAGTPAEAALLFTPGAEASASASSVGNDAGTQTNQNAVSTSAVREVTDPDFARGEAQATTNGPLRSRSEASAASGNNQPTQASATARWAANFTTTGANPGSAVDIDFVFNVDGVMSYLNNNSGAGANDIAAGVTISLGAMTSSGTTSLFNGTARLASVSNTTAPNLVRIGDWTSSSRDGDFAFQSGCDRFFCSVDVDASIAIADSIFVDFSEVFAISVELSTDAFAFAGFETGAISDFLNTATVALSTSTPGVNLQVVPTVNVVPAPSALWVFLVGLGGLMVMRGRRR